MHALIVVRTYVKLGALNALQYRANFVFDLLNVATYLVSVLLTIGLIFRQTDSLHGWNADELVAVAGIQILVGGFVGLVIRPSMQQLMENIRVGTLDFMLIKSSPVSQ